jgi:hypothetical protein
MEAAAKLLVQSTEADAAACQNAVEALERERRQISSDSSQPQMSAQAGAELGVPPSSVPTLTRAHPDDTISVHVWRRANTLASFFTTARDLGVCAPADAVLLVAAQPALRMMRVLATCTLLLTLQ